MAEDDVGAKPGLLLKGLHRLNCAKACASGHLPILGETKRVLGRFVKGFVGQRMHARDLHVAALCQEHQFMAALRRQPMRQLAILARHVLMHE